MQIIKPILVVLLSSTIFSCATITHVDDAPQAPLAPEVAASPLPQVALSEWYVDSLTSCKMKGSQLESFIRTPQNDIWQRIRQGFRLLPVDNSRVQQQLKWYGGHPRYMSKMSEHGAKYLHHIVEELEKRNMPMEIALIPIVESAFNPVASGPSDATGLWQFLPGTARVLGIKKNNWYDGRRDIVISTDAALDYLQSLNQEFNGDWMLAISAYNRGSRSIAEAMQKNRKSGKPTDYWSLDFPKEAGTYLPRLLAIRAVLENPDRYGVSLYPIPNRPYFTEISVGGPISLSQAAQFANVSVDELFSLNAGCIRGTTDPTGPHRLIVPSDKAEIFSQRLATTPIEKPTSSQHYTVLAEDTLSSIAMRNKTTVEELRAVNNLKSGEVTKGKVLLIPTATDPNRRPNASSTPTPNPAPEKSQHYKVVEGDSLWSIAKRFKISIQSLIKTNNLSPNHAIHPGQVLTILGK